MLARHNSMDPSGGGTGQWVGVDKYEVAAHFEAWSEPPDCDCTAFHSDLAEIYDLDITRESYRAIFYQRLRDRLGISRDYKTLQDRMETLYRATSTFHENKEEKTLVVLTAAIVILSVLILIGTIIIAGKPGA